VGWLVVNLIEHVENGAHYDLGNGNRRFVFDGTINRYDKVSKLWTPQRLVMSEAVDIAGGKALLTGRFGYWIDLNGTVRVYPDPDDATKYLEVGSINPVPLSVRQVNDKYIELFYEQPNGLVRWSFIISDRGFKTNIRVREGYTGNGQLNLRFELVGLQRQGHRVYDGDVIVGKMPDSFATDGNGEIHPVSESVVDGVVTLGVNIQNPVWPIDIDPTFGPIEGGKDTYLFSNAPNSGFGQSEFLTFAKLVNDTRRCLEYYDISAIPVGATVTSADLVKYQWFNNMGAGEAVTVYRVTRTDWEDAGNNTPNARANWNSYSISGGAWTTAGGDYDATVSDAYTTEAGTSITTTFNVINNAQDAGDNRSGAMHILTRLDDEATNVGAVGHYSLERATASQRPKLTIDYAVAGATFNRSRIVNMGAIGPQNRSTIANA
jgi:hypothetical protein